MLPLKPFCASFARRTEGSVAIMFGLTCVALITVGGIAVDYGRISLAKTRLQEAADSAVLSAVSLQLDPGANSAAQAATLRQNAIARFKALAQQQGVLIKSAKATASSAPSAPAVTLTFTGSIPAAFGELVGMENYAPGGTASATAAAGGAPGPTGGPPKYIDIYLLIDISGSMGIGASPADQLLMNQTPNVNCMLGCHADGTDVLARQAGATLRIDVVKTAIQQILTAAQSSVAKGTKVRFALMTFAGDVTTNASITSNLSAVSNAAANIQLAGDHAGTSAYAALQYVKSQISVSGDGSSATKPLVYVILATDGTSDSAYNTGPSTQPSAWQQANPNFDPPYSTVSESAPFPHAVPSLQGNDQFMQLEGVDPAWCQPLKSVGINVMTLEMPYVIPTAATGLTQFETNDVRMSYIQNALLPVIPAQLSACASQPSYHISATSPSDIMAAMNSLFTLTQTTPESVPRLTN